MIKKISLRTVSKRIIAYMLALAMVAAFLPAQIAKAVGFEDYNDKSVADLLKSDDNLTWVFAGDSITHNATFTAGMNGYGEWFEQYLNATGRDDDTVIISAWGGADIYDFQTLANTPSGSGTYEYPGMGLENFVTKYNPDVVFISVGMNDRYKTTEVFTRYYKMMLDSIKTICKDSYNKIPKIVLLTPTPLSSENVYDDMQEASKVDDNWDSTLRHCNAIETIAKEYGFECVNMREAFMEEYLRLGDEYFATFFRDSSDGGIHPNAAGQYLMFKQFSKTLGLDTSISLYQYEYKDFLAGELFTDLTSNVIYANDYNKVIDSENVDSAELLASVDFTSENGNFWKTTAGAYEEARHFDLTDASQCTDPLTLEEAKSLTNEFSIVFRAKLNQSYNTSQPVLLIGQTEDNWNNALEIGVPGKTGASGKAAALYYGVRVNNATQKNTGTNTYYVETSSNTTADGQWHDFALVQEADKLVYYIDGVEFWRDAATSLKSGFNIGSLVSEGKFVAMIGSYTKTSKSYNLNGDMDFYQLYKGALTAEQVKALADASGKFEAADASQEMNKTMPVLSTGTKTIASVDLNSTNGVFAGTTSYATSKRVSLTDESVCTDVLTTQEAKALTNEFSIVFRAQLNVPTNGNATQSVLFIGTKSNSWLNALLVGAPGKTDGIYYGLRGATSTTQNTKPSSQSGYTYKMSNGTNAIVDGSWHTIAIVQSASDMRYYVDGKLYSTIQAAVKSGVSIGDSYSSLSDTDAITAYIGSATSSDMGSYNLHGSMDFYQLYGTALSAAEVAELAGNPMDATMPSLNLKAAQKWESAYKWIDVAGEKTAYEWLVAGGEQLMGNDGAEVNRSLYRLIDNAIRRTPTHRGTRLIDVASKDSTVSNILASYDEDVAAYSPHAYMLLPEISQVYQNGYEHSEQAVADFKAAVQTWLTKNKANNIISILWTPLAAADGTVNGYISDYADAVRELVKTNDVLFFDANRFMNENMAANGNLARNWFSDEKNLSALGARDVAYAFCMMSNLTRIADSNQEDEISQHDLRKTTDTCIFKGEYVRDNIASAVSVSGTSVSVDISAIKAIYPQMTDFSFAVLPFENASSYNTQLYTVETTIQDNIYTFIAPCSNPSIAVFGTLGETTYRFADVTAKVTTDDVRNPEANPDGAYLDFLEVVGAPALTFDKNTKTYNVTLYQYQRYVQILAKAQNGLKIEVDGKEVTSGENSDLITVDSEKRVEVKVSGTVNGKEASATYTLNLTRPDYPDIIITEVMQDGEYTTGNGGDDYELVEIYNTTDRELNLKDYSLGYKTDYRYTALQSVTEYPTFYFTGDNQAFAARSDRSRTYTGINQITKYSSYWSGGETEPDYIAFPAKSTMVIWVKAIAKNVTYESLIADLKAAGENYTLHVDGQPVVPDMDQLVVAEVPAELASTISSINSASQHAALKPASSVSEHFYLNNFTGENATSNNYHTRGWLFILQSDAVRDDNGSITEAGNDIISAGKFARLASTNKLSSVFSYNVERGMSLVKDEAVWASNVSTGHTSDQQGYSNKTSFGAIEYWQKPYELADTKELIVKNNTPAKVPSGTQVTIDLDLTDDTDVRYIELYVRKAGETGWSKVTKDFVLAAGMANKGVSANQTKMNYTYDLGSITDTVEYYGFVLDGNNNKTTFGSEKEALKITIGEDIVVAFETNGGSEVASINVEDGLLEEAKVTETVKNGYIFTGWYTDKDCTNKVTFPLAVTQSITLYAGWEEVVIVDELVVEFNTGGGTEIPNAIIKNGTLEEVAEPAKDGYTFTGWYTDEDCTNKVTFPLSVTESMTLYAGWQENSVTPTPTPTPTPKPEETPGVVTPGTDTTTSTTTPGSTTTSPVTGDSFQILYWVVLMGAAAAVVVFFVVRKRRNK